MSLVPRNNSNSPTPFTPFPQDFWDGFFSQDRWLEPFRDLPFFRPPFPFLSPPRTVPYSELSIETSGDVKARLECKEIPEAHIIVADLPGIGKNEVSVEAEGGGFVKISGGGGRFSWRMRLPEDAQVDMMNWSMENGVLTVIVPKFAGAGGFDWGWGSESSWPRNVRPIEITGPEE